MSGSATEKWEALVARGCTCGSEHYTPCPIHTGPSDNRGIRAWFEAGGMRRAFPMEDCRCAVCGTGGCLIYPNTEIDDPDGSGEYRRTLVCPSCSSPAAESFLRWKASEFGYQLKPVTVFGVAA